MKHYELTTEQWKRVKALLPPEETGKRGRPRKDNRTMLNGMLWIARSGAQWRELPEAYGPWQSVYARFAKWRDDGTLETVFHALSEDADMENLSIDSTCIKVHESANGGEKNRGYRRCVWTQHGMKRPVWRCVSRLDYGKKFCTQSPTLDEEPLQQAILAAVNAVMLDRDTLARQLAAVMERELAPVPGESMSLADIDRALEELSSQFNSLLAEASANPGVDYTERFRELSESTARLRERKARLEGACQEQGRVQRRLLVVSAAMEHMSSALTEWDEDVIHQLLEKVTVLSREKIRVTFRDGREIEQYVAQPKRRKLA